MVLENDGPTDAHKYVLQLLATETRSPGKEKLELFPSCITRSAGYKDRNHISMVCRERADADLLKINELQLCRDAGYTGNAGTADFEWSPREYATAYVTEGKEWESGDAITGGYRHSWSGTVSGIGVSFPYGVSFSASSSVKSEDLGSQLDGDNLRVVAADGTC